MQSTMIHGWNMLAAMSAVWLLSVAPAQARTAPEETADSFRADAPASESPIVDVSAPQQDQNPNKLYSLFYSQEEVTDIRLAVNTYLKHVNNREDLTFDEEAFLNRLKGLKTNAPSRFYTYPQFFLDSLVYHKSDDWVIWLNGQKITQATAAESNNIHVLEITGEKVKFEWLPPAMEKVLEIWNQFPNEETFVDQLRGKVVFTLKPNQTFSSYVMKTLEGKVLPVTVDVSRTAPSLKSKSPKSTAAAPIKQAVEDLGKEGLSGLIQTYENLKEESPQP